MADTERVQKGCIIQKSRGRKGGLALCSTQQWHFCSVPHSSWARPATWGLAPTQSMLCCLATKYIY